MRREYNKRQKSGENFRYRKGKKNKEGFSLQNCLSFPRNGRAYDHLLIFQSPKHLQPLKAYDNEFQNGRLPKSQPFRDSVCKALKEVQVGMRGREEMVGEYLT